MRIGLLAAGAAFIALGGASQAFAGDAACLWAHLPADQREAVVADFQTSQKLDTSKLDPKTVAKAENGCGVPDESKAAADQALSAFIMQTASSRWLAANAQLPTDKLDAAWAAFDAKTKRDLVDAVREGTIGKALAPALNAFEVQLGRTPTPAAAVQRATPGYNLILYILGRSQRAAFESKF